jgi:hypothetical protein
MLKTFSEKAEIVRQVYAIRKDIQESNGPSRFRERSWKRTIV